jgi:hypothetical protein
MAEAGAEEYVGDSAFLQNEAILTAVLSEFSLEERMAMNPWELGAIYQSCGTPHFRAEVLPLLAKAVRRREAGVTEILDSIFVATKIAQDDHPAVQRVKERLRRKASGYRGPVTFRAVLHWAVDELAGMALAVQALRGYEAQPKMTFAEIYRQGYAAAWDGVWDVLRDCPDLGASEEEARELVNRTFIKVWFRLDDWNQQGTASIQTRIRAFAKKQAMGWRTQRLRERAREALLRGEFGDADYRGARSGKKPSLAFYDDRRYDPVAG